MRNPEAPLDQRVRIACSIGAVLTGLIDAGSYFSDVSPDELTDHVRAVIAVIFRPRQRLDSQRLLARASSAARCETSRVR